MTPSITVGKEDMHTSDLQGVFQGKKVRVDSSASSDPLPEFEMHEAPPSFGQTTPGNKQVEIRADVRQMEKKALDSAMRKLPDMRRPSFERFLGTMRRARHSKDYSALKDEACELFPEVSHRHAAILECAAMQNESGGDSDLAHFLQQYAEELLEENGPDIQASYNISRIALQELGDNLEALQSGRDFYRKAVFSFDLPGESYQFLIEESPKDISFGPVDTSEGTPEDARALTRKLQDSLKFLRQCLGADLHAINPSQEPVFLKGVMDGLYNVEFIGNAHESGLELLQKFHDSYDSGVKIQPYRLMKHILDSMTADFIPPDRFLDISWEVRIPPAETTIHFLTQLYEVVRELPLKVYPAADSREKLLQAVQLSLDIAIDEEQKQLGETPS